MRSTGALPNVVVIGTMKCGSTSLHNYLDIHPDVSMSQKKELNFFYRHGEWRKGLDWYRAQFDAEAPVRGESSVNYTKNPTASRISAERMHRVLPGVRLIYLVRDPVSRSISHYLHTYAKGEEGRTVSDALSELDSPYVARSLYYANLEPYLDFFSTSDVLIVSQEALLARRQRTMGEIFRFLGVNEIMKSPEFKRMYQTAAEKLRAGGAGPADREFELDDAVRRRLEEHFAPDIKRLRKLSARRLSS